MSEQPTLWTEAVPEPPLDESVRIDARAAEALSIGLPLIRQWLRLSGDNLSEDVPPLRFRDGVEDVLVALERLVDQHAPDGLCPECGMPLLRCKPGPSGAVARGGWCPICQAAAIAEYGPDG